MQDVKRQIDEALTRAKASPQPPMEDLWANIWKGGGGAGLGGGPIVGGWSAGLPLNEQA